MLCTIFEVLLGGNHDDHCIYSDSRTIQGKIATPIMKILTAVSSYLIAIVRAVTFEGLNFCGL